MNALMLLIAADAEDEACCVHHNPFLLPSLQVFPLLTEKQPESHWSLLPVSFQLNSSRMKKALFFR